MSKPKVFISHSSQDNKTAKELADFLSSDFDVLLDMIRLEGGQDWQDRIEKWMLECKAAIILLSAYAEQSDWVQNEAYVLSFRQRNADPTLRLIPILLEGYTDSNLRNAKCFSPALLAKIQLLSMNAGNAIYAEVSKLLEPIIAEYSEEPYEAAKTALAHWLRKESLDVIDKIREGLGLEERYLEIVYDKPRWLAHHLLRISSIDTLASVASRLRQCIDKICAQELVTRLLPFCWVDIRMATRLAEHARSAPPHAPLAMYTVYVETPQMYIWKASGRSDGWPVIMCPNDWSHQDPAGWIISKIRDEVAFQLLGFMPEEIYTEEDFESELADFLEREQALVILFPAPFSELDKDCLIQVTSVSLFDRMVLFLRCDKPAEPLLSPKLQKVIFLDRPDETLEKRAMRISRQFYSK